ncbi:MAG: hypothetical protein WCA35_15145 [Kovacikia sp.]
MLVVNILLTAHTSNALMTDVQVAIVGDRGKKSDTHPRQPVTPPSWRANR